MPLVSDEMIESCRFGHRSIPWYHKAKCVDDRPVHVVDTVWRSQPYRRICTNLWFVHIKCEKTEWERKLRWIDGAVDPVGLARFLDFVKNYRDD